MFKKGHTFIIAEIGSNHNQDIHRAFELMEVAKEAGADAVKFQSINMNRLIAKEDRTQETIRLFEQINLQEAWYERIFSHAKKLGIECLSAPTYLEAIPLLQQYHPTYIKIASPQTYGYPELIKKVAQTGLKTIMSTGYCQEWEIDRAVRYYRTYGKPENLALLHCVSHYPTKACEVNLRYLDTMRSTYKVPVGFSDHTQGSAVALGAVALGAELLEKHITLSRQDRGPDHFFAAEPNEFRDMVNSIRTLEQALGENQKQITAYEQAYRDSLTVYPYAKRDLKKGTVVGEADIEYYRSKRPGISPWDTEEQLIGQELREDIKKGSPYRMKGCGI